MSDATSVSENPDDMEALFDSIVRDNATRNASAAPAVTESSSPLPSDPSEPTQVQSAVTAGNLISRVGQLTRTLHESLRELGYDKVIEKTSAAIPDARDRLAYVITMTEKAADRTLNATDIIKPIQDELAESASSLNSQWDSLFAKKLSIEEFKHLVSDTRGYLAEVPKQTAVTNAQLMEIMMAQDFQDLTGQVIKKTTEIIHTLERELLQLLLDSVPMERRPAAVQDDGLLNGPLVNATGRTDVVTSQNQVDDLLESLGF